jgi:hypothetical protein
VEGKDVSVKGRNVPVLFGQDSDIIGFVIRCEMSDEEFDSDILTFAAEFKSGDREALDEEGEVIDPATITDEQAHALAVEELTEGDWGRDGWRVSWVHWESPSDRPGYDRLTFQANREGWTIFPTLLAAQDFIDKHMPDTSETLEIWGVTS